MAIVAKELLRGKDLPKELTKTVFRPSDEIKRHQLVTEEMVRLFAKKNKDYGNSFERSLDEDGPLVSKIRLGDKYSRFASLIKEPQNMQVKDESIRDTLIDMANYAVMTIAWLDKQEERRAMEQMKELEAFKVDPNVILGTSVTYGVGDGYNERAQIVNEIREEENAK